MWWNIDIYPPKFTYIEKAKSMSCNVRGGTSRLHYTVNENIWLSAHLWFHWSRLQFLATQTSCTKVWIYLVLVHIKWPHKWSNIIKQPNIYHFWSRLTQAVPECPFDPYFTKNLPSTSWWSNIHPTTALNTLTSNSIPNTLLEIKTVISTWIAILHNQILPHFFSNTRIRSLKATTSCCLRKLLTLT